MQTMEKSKIYVCHCCGKKFKTETGFKKHFCMYQQRFVDIETHNWYNKWCIFKTIYNLKVSKDKTKEYYSFMHSSFYNQFITFLKWCDKVEIFDFNGYLEYTKCRNFPMKTWCDDKTYKGFLESYLLKELPAIANDRSKKYLESNSLTLDNISQNRLYFSLLTGVISNKYLRSVNFDVSKVLDPGQLNDLRGLLV